MTDPKLTPPPELVQQWVAEIWHEGTPVRVGLSDEHIATRAAQWGADCELDACCEWLDDACLHFDSSYLRSARRPKPPSLREQALEALDRIKTSSPSDKHWSNLMTDQHPITPPPELVQQWIEQGVSRPLSTDYVTFFATQADIIRRALEALPE
jgi:hypothetical protein